MKRTLQECYHHGEGNLTDPEMITINHKYNRMEYFNHAYSLRHAYRVYHGTEPIGNSIYKAVIKCKLIFSESYELITPDLIYIKTSKYQFKWFQFYHFQPGLFARKENYKFYLPVDISGGQRIIVSFSIKDFIRKLPDNSNLYNCTIEGPKNIREYATGEGKIIENVPYIYLYHHTKEETKELILKSKYLIGSKWNYQGNKKLKNLEYCYFTSINKIMRPIDLKLIAMATNERILAIVDKTLEKIPVKIPRQSTTDRKATIEFLVDTSIINNNHINQRMYDAPDNIDYFYAMYFPYIYRVGIKKGAFLKFNKNFVIRRSDNILSPNYIIMGQSYTREGVLAPFHEEETDHIGKIIPLSDDDLITTALKNLGKRKEIFRSLPATFIEFMKKE